MSSTDPSTALPTSWDGPLHDPTLNTVVLLGFGAVMAPVVAGGIIIGGVHAISHIIRNRF